MRQRRWQPADDVDMIDVTQVEDEDTDEFLALLHELALEAIARRASSPGDPHLEPSQPDVDLEPPPAPASGRRWRAWPPRPGPGAEGPTSGR